MKSKIACIVLNYNDYVTTAELINKIRDYSVLDYIIIVDNKSTDDSLARLSLLENNNIIVVSSDKNGGYGYGNNIGLKYAIDVLKCQYCLIANPDVIFEEKIVPRMISFLKENDEYGVVSPYQKGTKKQAWKKVNFIKDQLFYSLILNKIFNPRYYSDDYFNNIECDVYAVKGCFVMFKSEAIKSIDYYDEDFFLFEEEKVIALKLENKGYKSAVLTDIDYIHNHSVSIKKTFFRLGQRKRLVLNSNELYLRKYMGIKGVKMFFVKIYHFYCYLESIVYDFVLALK